jgi:hypothetical protein
MLVCRSGSVTHIEHLRARFQFLSFVLFSSSLTLSASQLDTLWVCFVEEATCAEERELFCECLSNVCTARDARSALQADALDRLFDVRLPTLDFAQLSASAHSLIERLFVDVNERTSAVRFVDSKLVASLAATGQVAVLGGREARADDDPSLERRAVPYANADKLAGLNMLWRACLEAQQPAIAQRALLFLNTLYQNLTPDALKNAKMCRYRDAHVQFCIKYLLDAVAKLGGVDESVVAATSAQSSAATTTKSSKKKKGASSSSGGGGNSGESITTPVTVVNSTTAYTIGDAADAERVVERCLRLLAQLLDGFAELDVRRKMEPGQALAPQAQLKLSVRLDNGRVFTLLVSPTDTVKLLRHKLTEEYKSGAAAAAPADNVAVRIVVSRRELVAADDNKAVSECEVTDGATLFVSRKRDSDDADAGDGGFIESLRNWGARLRGASPTSASSSGAASSTTTSSAATTRNLAEPQSLDSQPPRALPPPLLGAMGHSVEPITTMSLRPPKPTPSVASAASATNSSGGEPGARMRSVEDFPRGWPNVALAVPQTFNVLFELLQRDNIAEHVFRLLDQLPSSESMLDSLRKLSSGWQSLFDNAHPHRQLYAVRLVLHLIDVTHSSEAIIAEMEHVGGAPPASPPSPSMGESSSAASATTTTTTTTTTATTTTTTATTPVVDNCTPVGWHS